MELEREEIGAQQPVPVDDAVPGLADAAAHGQAARGQAAEHAREHVLGQRLHVAHLQFSLHLRIDRLVSVCWSMQQKRRILVVLCSLHGSGGRAALNNTSTRQDGIRVDICSDRVVSIGIWFSIQTTSAMHFNLLHLILHAQLPTANYFCNTRPGRWGQEQEVKKRTYVGIRIKAARFM